MSAFLGEEPLAVMGEAVHGYCSHCSVLSLGVYGREREREREYQADAGTVRLWLPFAQSQMLKL